MYGAFTYGRAPYGGLGVSEVITTTALQKTLRYGVGVVNAPTKALKYTVRTTVAALTKGLKYTVRITPTATIKSLRYAVAVKTTPTKSLKYVVRFTTPLTKQLKYTVRTTIAAITKALKYTVRITAAALTKALQYTVYSTAAPSKSLKYTVYTTPTAATKALQYAVRQSPSAIQKSLQYVVRDRIYTRGILPALPGDTADLDTQYSNQDYADVAAVDDIEVGLTGEGYAIHLYKFRNADTSNVNITWHGSCGLAPSTSTVYLQIYDNDINEWITLDSNNTTDSNTTFILEGSTGGLAKYYDVNNTVIVRVWQQSS